MATMSRKLSSSTCLELNFIKSVFVVLVVVSLIGRIISPLKIPDSIVPIKTICRNV